MALTVTEFAARMGLSRQTVYDYIKRGLIVPVRFRDGGAIRIPDRYLEPSPVPENANRPSSPPQTVQQPVRIPKDGKTFRSLCRREFLKQQEASHGTR